MRHRMVLLLLAASAAVWAQAPNTLQDGDIISASELNQNFNALDTEDTALQAADVALQAGIDALDDCPAGFTQVQGAGQSGLSQVGDLGDIRT